MIGEKLINQKPRDPWLHIILLWTFVLRTYHLGYPAWDYHNWRQTITLMVARDLARHGFPLLHPQVAWLGNGPADPSYFSAEFSIQSVLAALLYKAFGESEILARLVVIAFSLLGIYCLYNLLNRRAGRTVARLGAFIYAMLPYHLFFGRVFMPDIPAITLALAGLAVLDRWSDNRKLSCLFAAALLTALAILQKPRLTLVALPVIYLFWSVYGKSFWKRREPYLFALVACIPELAWYAHAASLEPHNAVSAFNIPRELFASHLGLWVQGPFVLRLLNALSDEAFSTLGFGLAIMGLVFAPRARVAWLFRLWLGGAALLLFLMPGVLEANLYYLAMFLPGGAALGGMALARLPGYGRAIVLVCFSASAIYSALPLYEPDRSPYELGILLDSLTNPGDLLATESGGSPNVLYYADRRGWLLERNYRVERVERLAQAGARYYADTFEADATGQRPFFHAMDAKFARLTAPDAPWQIYDLAAQPGPLHTPDGNMPVQRGVNFGDQIQFRGVFLRLLMGWPDSFEAIYYWQCSKTPPIDLRVFVHITNEAGGTVAQQDHDPQGSAYPASKWKAGDMVRERYVLTLPGSLAPGKYHVRVGWFDPGSGLRLPVLNPGTADKDGSAQVADIDIPPAPVPGWFSAE